MPVCTTPVVFSRHADIPDSGSVPNLASCFGFVDRGEWHILAIIISI